jgi:hypothetical protein
MTNKMMLERSKLLRTCRHSLTTLLRKIKIILLHNNTQIINILNGVMIFILVKTTHHDQGKILSRQVMQTYIERQIKVAPYLVPLIKIGLIGNASIM